MSNTILKKMGDFLKSRENVPISKQKESEIFSFPTVKNHPVLKDHFIGIATEDCKVGDIIRIEISEKGECEVFPMIEEMEESFHSLTSSSKSSFRIDSTSDIQYRDTRCTDDVDENGISDVEHERMKEEYRKKEEKNKKVIAKKKRIIPIEPIKEETIGN